MSFRSPHTHFRNLRLYARGFNAQGQLGLGNGLRSSSHFQEIASLTPDSLSQEGLSITHLAADHCQNIAVLNGDRLLHWGWPPCPLTTYRSLWTAQFYPFVPRLLFRFAPFLWQAVDQPSFLFDFQHSSIQKLSLGWGFGAALVEEEEEGGRYVYAWGNNDSGQLGSKETSFKSNPIRVVVPSGSSMADMSCGY